MIVREARIRYQLICLYRQRIAFCAAGVGGAEMASGLDPFWRPDVVHAPTGMQALRLRIWRRAGVRRSGVYCAQPGLSRHVLCTSHECIQLPWSFFNIHGLEFNGQIFS